MDVKAKDRTCFCGGMNGKGHVSWALVESIRTARGSRQKVVAYLGVLKRGERNGWAQLGPVFRHWCSAARHNGMAIPARNQGRIHVDLPTCSLVNHTIGWSAWIL